MLNNLVNTDSSYGDVKCDPIRFTHRVTNPKYVFCCYCKIAMGHSGCLLTIHSKEYLAFDSSKITNLLYILPHIHFKVSTNRGVIHK